MPTNKILKLLTSSLEFFSGLATTLFFSASCLKMAIFNPAQNRSNVKFPSLFVTFLRFSTTFFGKFSLFISSGRHLEEISAKN